MRLRIMTSPKLRNTTRSLPITSIRRYARSAVLLTGKTVLRLSAQTLATSPTHLMNGCGDVLRSMTMILCMTSTPTSCGRSSVPIIMISMPITMIFTIGNLTAIQKICLKKSSMRNMSSSIGMIISPVGRSFPHTTIGAVGTLHREHITEPNRTLISMTGSPISTVSSRLRSHQSFRSMRTMTVISASQTATVCLMRKTITEKQASSSWITAGIPAQATRSTTSTTIPTHFSLCTAESVTTAVFGVGTAQMRGSWYLRQIPISGTAV